VQFTVTVWLEAHKLAKEAEIKQAQDPNSVNENSESAKIGVSNSRRLFMTGEAITSEMVISARLDPSTRTFDANAGAYPAGIMLAK